MRTRSVKVLIVYSCLAICSLQIVLRIVLPYQPGPPYASTLRSAHPISSVQDGRSTLRHRCECAPPAPCSVARAAPAVPGTPTLCHDTQARARSVRRAQLRPRTRRHRCRRRWRRAPMAVCCRRGFVDAQRCPQDTCRAPTDTWHLYFFWV